MFSRRFAVFRRGIALAQVTSVRSDQNPQSFELHSPVWYRTSRDTAWRTGISFCLSTRGAVIHTDDPPSVFDAVDVVIAISDTGCLAGRGRVIRTQPSGGASLSGDFSIAVDHYSIGHRDTVL